MDAKGIAGMGNVMEIEFMIMIVMIMTGRVVPQGPG